MNRFIVTSSVVANISYSKIESKSQRPRYLSPIDPGCCKYQLFKDRKQITTVDRLLVSVPKLLQISVIQRSKANHNNHSTLQWWNMVVANISYSKIESKSQPQSILKVCIVSCCKYQLFKDRKQITTHKPTMCEQSLLLQISVIQRSKANHNG